MITIDDTQVELLPYPLWVVWQEAFTTCSSIQLGEPQFARVFGISHVGDYCIQRDTGALDMIKREDLFVVGALTTFDQRAEAVAHLATLHSSEERHVQHELAGTDCLDAH